MDGTTVTLEQLRAFFTPEGQPHFDAAIARLDAATARAEATELRDRLKELDDG